MRNYLLILTLFCSLFATAQTMATNPWFDLSYIATLQNEYVIRVNNKQECESEVRLSVGSGNHTFHKVGAGRTIEIKIPFTTYQAGLAIKIKTEVTCMGSVGNSGWLGIRTPSLSPLPLKEPVRYTPPVKVKNETVQIIDIMGRHYPLTNTQDLTFRKALLPPGNYVFVSESKREKYIKRY